MEARKERKGVPDDQKLSTNGGFWTLPLYGHQLSPSPHTGLFTYFFVFANKVTNNLDKFHFPTSRDRESP
jgi:hypothetical protein